MQEAAPPQEAVQWLGGWALASAEHTATSSQSAGKRIIVATDGSGGKHAKDKRLRRIGFGGVALDPKMFTIVGAMQDTIAMYQTVPVAETLGASL